MQLKQLLAITPVLALAAVHHVDVGEGGLKFTPKTLTAAAGDVVIFQLHSNHNVAQSSFDQPCTPSGFYSGPFSGSQNGALRFVLEINSTDPIYYYCGVPGHCQGGMLGGINLPSSGNDADAFTTEAQSASSGSAPSGVTGGQLLSEDAAEAFASSASGSATSSLFAAASTGSAAASNSAASSSASASAASSNSASASRTSASASAAASTGAAANVQREMPGVLAAIFGFAALML